MTMLQNDVIIVLGGGVNPDGSLPEIPWQRVEKGVALLREGRAPRLVMSGRWDFWRDDEPSTTEAVSMKAYAVALGVSDDVIFTEEESKDTLGNAYFCKVRYLTPRCWRRVAAVTSDYHLPRTEYIFQRVLGDAYAVSYESVSTELPRESLTAIKEKEAKILQVLSVWFQSIALGDDGAVGRLLYSKHPGYAEHPEVTKEQLLKMLGK